MSNNSKNLNYFRQKIYKEVYTSYPYVKDWRTNPYTCFKSHLYMEGAAIVVALLQNTNIHPNWITLVYIIMGVLGGLCLSASIEILSFIGILLIFFKGIFDWADGLHARLTNQTSITGDILDPYGAIIGWIFFWVGIILYSVNRSENIYFLYMGLILLAIWVADPMSFAKRRFFDKYLSPEKLQGMQNGSGSKKIAQSEIEALDKSDSIFRKIYRFMNQLFTARARFVDSVCLLLLIEIFSGLFIVWIIFVMFFLWQCIVFCIQFYFVAQGGAEARFENKLENIYQSVQSQNSIQ